MKMKGSSFDRLLRNLDAVAVQNVDKIEVIDVQTLGYCENFYIENHENKDYYKAASNYKPTEVWDNFDPSLMIFEGQDISKGLSILVSGDDF